MSDTTRELPIPEAWKPFTDAVRKIAPGAVDETPPRKSLVSKLAEVQLAVERVPKRGHNQHFNYDFATESDITATIRKELATRSVMLVPSVQALTWREVSTKAAVNAVCCAMVRFTAIDGETGERLEFVIPGEGQDSGDKCVPKALTNALKYALLKLFMIPTGDDPELQGKDRKEEKSAPKRPIAEALGVTTHAVSESAKATIPDGCALIVQVKQGTFGKAKAEITLVDSSGVEGHYAMFDTAAIQRAVEAGTSLVRPVWANPKAGGKIYVKDIQPAVPLDDDIPF